MRSQILWAKSSDDVPDITKLYEQDANGHYTPMSFANTQEWKKYAWTKGLDIKKSHLQPTSRYPLSSYNALTLDPNQTGSGTIDVERARDSLNKAQYYLNKKTKCSYKLMFKNGSDTIVEQMKPYLLLRSDVIDSTGDQDYDPIAISGQIRMTYVDN